MKGIHRHKGLLAAAALLALSVDATGAVAAGGTLDPTFGRGGISVLNATQFPDAYERSGRLRVDSFGRSVFAVQSDRRILVERRLADGRLDPGFGSAGRVAVDIDGSERDVIDLELVEAGADADGFAVLSQSRFGGPCYVSRLDRDGNPVPAFGTSGALRVFDPAVDTDARCIDLALDGAQSLVALNVPATPLTTQAVVLAFDAQGAPRAGFGSSGRLLLGLTGSGASFRSADWLDVTGSAIFVAGRAILSETLNVYVARLDRDTGAFDPTFSGDGVWFDAQFDAPSANPYTTLAGKVEADGIVLLGLPSTFVPLRFWKLGVGGELDPAFGTDGRCNGGLPSGTGFMGTRQRQAELITDGPHAVAVLGAERTVDTGTVAILSIDRSTCAPSGAFAVPRIAIDEPPFSVNGHGFAGAALQGTRLLVGGVIGSPRLDASVHAHDRASGAIVDVATGERVVLVNGTIPSFDAPKAAGRSGSGTVVAGVTFLGAWTTLYALRLDDLGRLDPTFGSAGVRLIPVQQAYPLPFAAALVRDDGILLAGTRAYAAQQPSPKGIDEPIGPHLYRLTPGGDVDAGFGGSGVATPAIGSTEARVVALGSDGDAILMLSRDNVGATPASILHRLSAGGLVDPGFAGGAPLRFAGGGADINDRFDAVVANSTAIYVAGTDPSFSGRIVIRAFTRNGLPLPGFGSQGRLTVPIPAVSRAAPVAMSVWGEQLLVAGIAFTSAGSEVAIARLDASGVQDASFGTQGIARLPLGSTGSDVASATLHRDGEALLVATTRRPGPSFESAPLRMSVARLDSTGRLDPGFGAGGVAQIDVANEAGSIAAGLAVFPEHYVVAGASVGRTAAAKLTRGALDRIFDDGFE